MASDRITHYRIIGKLGRGGMGEVYLAEDTRLGRRVALKLLLPDYTRDPDRLRRFEQEARAASALNHPNILTIYEVGQADGRHYISTEFVDGTSLRQLIAGGRLTVAEALDIAVQLASALDAAHTAGIVHRDIKPDNVMVRRDGYVKVLDFGLAKLSERPRAHAETDHEADTMELFSTEPGKIMGTTAYMSPEQARGIEVDARTDIWSLGVVLYEMVAGRTPFAGETGSHVVVSILEQEPPPLSAFADGVPAELQRIVGRALAKHRREERYQTVRDMLIDLRKLKQRMEAEAHLGRGDETGAPDGLGAATAYAGGVGAVTRAQGADTVTGRETVGQGGARATAAATGSATGGVHGPTVALTRGRVLALAALIAAGVVAVGAYLYNARARKTTVDAIAVLPFVNAGGDPSTEWLSDGITESLINSLSPSPGLKVMSLSAVFRYKGRDVEPARAGRELGVGAVLTGRVAQRGEDLQVSVELIDARDNTHIWGEQYNRKLSDMLAVQDEIAREIARRLRTRLRPGADDGDAAISPRRYTESEEAYAAYLRGRYFWNKRSDEGFRRAAAYFNQAIEHDPAYALAYAGLADTYALMADYGITPPREAMPKARSAAERALAADPSLAEAHTSLGFVRMAFDWKWREAEESFGRAVELNPNYATAHQWYASCLLQTGRFDEALAEIRRAQSLDPLSLIINANSGLYLHYARQYDRAAEQLRRTLEVNDAFGVAHKYLGYVYLQQPGRTKDEAIAEFQAAVRYAGEDPEALAALGHAYAVAGRRAESLGALERLRERGRRGYVSPYHLAVVHTGLGEREQALRQLEAAYEERHPGMILMKFDPRFDPLRADPRFAELVRRVEQPQGS